jgi:hypothetical protein
VKPPEDERQKSEIAKAQRASTILTPNYPGANKRDGRFLVKAEPRVGLISIISRGNIDWIGIAIRLTAPWARRWRTAAHATDERHGEPFTNQCLADVAAINRQSAAATAIVAFLRTLGAGPAGAGNKRNIC